MSGSQSILGPGLGAALFKRPTSSSEWEAKTLSGRLCFGCMSGSGLVEFGASFSSKNLDFNDNTFVSWKPLMLRVQVLTDLLPPSRAPPLVYLSSAANSRTRLRKIFQMLVPLPCVFWQFRTMGEEPVEGHRSLLQGGPFGIGEQGQTSSFAHSCDQ